MRRPIPIFIPISQFCNWLSFYSNGQELYNSKNDSLVSFLLNNCSEGSSDFNFKLISNSEINCAFYFRNFKKHFLPNIQNSVESQPNSFIRLAAVVQSGKSDFIKRDISDAIEPDPCWNEPIIDTIIELFIDDDSFAELGFIIHHYPFCDSFLPYTQIVVYDDLGELSKGHRMTIINELSFTVDHLSQPSTAKVLNLIHEKMAEK